TPALALHEDATEHVCSIYSSNTVSTLLFTPYSTTAHYNTPSLQHTVPTAHHTPHTARRTQHTPQQTATMPCKTCSNLTLLAATTAAATSAAGPQAGILVVGTSRFCLGCSRFLGRAAITSPAPLMPSIAPSATRTPRTPRPTTPTTPPRIAAHDGAADIAAPESPQRPMPKDAHVWPQTQEPAPVMGRKVWSYRLKPGGEIGVEEYEEVGPPVGGSKEEGQ
ncbi:hypothetical protein EDC01DRAFT_750886, partial [Geopyxis carbonaria]